MVNSVDDYANRLYTIYTQGQRMVLHLGLIKKRASSISRFFLLGRLYYAEIFWRLEHSEDFDFFQRITFFKTIVNYYFKKCNCNIMVRTRFQTRYSFQAANIVCGQISKVSWGENWDEEPIVKEARPEYSFGFLASTHPAPHRYHKKTPRDL